MIDTSKTLCKKKGSRNERMLKKVLQKANEKVQQRVPTMQPPQMTTRPLEVRPQQIQQIKDEAIKILENEPDYDAEDENEEDDELEPPNSSPQIHVQSPNSSPQIHVRPPPPPPPTVFPVLKSFEDAERIMQEFFTEHFTDIESVDIVSFEAWIMIIQEYKEALEVAKENLEAKHVKAVEVMIEDYNQRYRSKLIEIMNKPTEEGRKLINYIFSFKNMEETDYVLNFIWQLIEETEEGGDPDKPESQEIFDSNMLILCKEEKLNGPDCVHVDITKSCITEKDGRKILNVENIEFKSVFAPQGMFLTFKKEGKNNKIRRLRGPFVWSHPTLFDNSKSIVIRSYNQFRKTNPKLRMDERDFYIINFSVKTTAKNPRLKDLKNNTETSQDDSIGDWTDNIYKRNVCVKNRKLSAMKGVGADLSTIKLYIPEGVTVALSASPCRGKWNKTNGIKLIKRSGPKEINLQEEYPQVHKLILLNAPKKMPEIVEDDGENDEEDQKEKEDDDEPDDGGNNNNDGGDDDDDEDEDEVDDEDKMSFCNADGDDCEYGLSIKELLEAKRPKMKASLVNVTIPADCYLPTSVQTRPGRPNKKANEEEEVCEIPVPSIRGPITKPMEDLLKIFHSDELKSIELVDEDDDDDDDYDIEDDTIKDDGRKVTAQRKSFLMPYGMPADAPTSNLMVQDFTRSHKQVGHHRFHPRGKHQQI